MNRLLCAECQKEVAAYRKIEGITTWFAVCSECLYGVKGWSKEEIEKFEKFPKTDKGEGS